MLSDLFPRQKLFQWALQVLRLALIYAAGDILLNRFGFSEGWTILWPLNGITIALLLMRPRSEWWIVVLGVTLGTGIGECIDHNPIGHELWLRTFSALEVVLSALLLPAFTTLDQWLRKPRIFLRGMLALIVGPGVSGLMAAVFFHVAEHQSLLIAFNQWATADALGIAAIIPLALSFGSAEIGSLFRRDTVLKTLLILIAGFSVITLSLDVSSYPLLFLIYPTLLIIDLLLSLSGSAIASAGLCLISIYLATRSHGVFGRWPHDLLVSRDVALQIFLAFNVGALFPMSVLIRERQTFVEDLNSSNAQLLMLASLDGLTGIPNRRRLDEAFTQEWKRAVRLRTPLALIMVDVDLFKGFNDQYGHQAGDDCLRSVAEAITHNIHRPQDVAARFGGEEFVLLLPHTDLIAAQALAERVRLAIFDLRIDHSRSPWSYVTVSLGCAAMIPILSGNQAELLALADAALYLAKNSGRNCVQIQSALQTSPLVVTD